MKVVVNVDGREIELKITRTPSLLESRSLLASIEDLEENRFLVVIWANSHEGVSHWGAKGKQPPKCIGDVIQKFVDVLTRELPDELPLKREVDHKIEVVSGLKTPSKAPYRLNQRKLEELKKQIMELLAKGYIRQSKSPYKTPVLFVDKKDGKLRIFVDY